MNYYDDDWFAVPADELVEDDDEDYCDHCGPWCEHWGGDGLCELILEEQARQAEEFERLYVEKDTRCPVCGQVLICYSIPTDELWTWPGDFYNPIIALEIYAIYGAPKDELHRSGNLVHIWIGEGQYREEKLVRLTGNKKVEGKPPF